MAEERKLVSVLFADVVGSTALAHENDPEVVRAVMARYFERVREIIETHGGSVEKFIGDAVMAVFGVPRLHDDDAERAVRAALAIRDAIEGLNDEVALRLEARIGVNTGEAVAAVDARQQALVTGDVVNVAARLQQHAAAGEVLVGPLTEQLTRQAIDYLPHQPIEARGKPEPIGAFRATDARSDLPEQARGLAGMRARLVGRTRELDLLLDTFGRSRSDQRGQLFTIVGSAGVGKSRLVGEFLAKVTGQGGARVLRGRCLPYGAGITYWPLLEVLQADLEVSAGQTRTDVLERLDARVNGLVSDERERAPIRSRLRVLLGLAEAAEALPDVDAGRLPAELGWGLARYLEAMAAQTPVVVVIDDLQWAEPPIVEIVGGLLDRTADVPILAVCIGRPDLLERYPTWGAGRPNSTLIVLEPLNEDETRTLIGRLLDIDDLPEELRTRIIGRAGGNPLFCEEFVRMLIEEGRLVRHDARWRATAAGSLDVRVPESIHALLAARLDAQPAEAKALIRAASVVGEAFDVDQLAAISAAEDLHPRLDALTRGGFILADRRSGPGAYRFRHLLIRDVAYGTLPKTERAGLHEAFGRHLEAAAGDRRGELTEILAYHAERALRLSLELRLVGDRLRQRAGRALDLAFDAADRAVERENGPALTAFLRTAHAAETALAPVAPGDAARLMLLDATAEALAADYVAARAHLERAADASLEAGRPDLAAAAYLRLVGVLTYAMGEEDEALLERATQAAIARFDEVGDLRGRLDVQLLATEELFTVGQLSRMLEESSRVVEMALAAGEEAVAARALSRLVRAASWIGRVKLALEFADRADALVSELGLTSTGRWTRFYRARIAWIQARFAEAERDTRRLMDDAEVVGDSQLVVASARLLGETLIEVGRIDEADAALATALERSLQIGERWSRTELLAQRAICATTAGDLAAAERFLAESAATVRGFDAAAVCSYESALGRLRAAQGRDAEAEAALRRSLETGRSTEYWWDSALALDLAEFLAARGRSSEAARIAADVRAAIAGAEVILPRLQLERLEARLAGQPA